MSETSKLDGSYLEGAQLEIELVADTHFLQPGMRGAEEFPSRGKQTDRARLVLGYFGDAEVSLHLGDLVQEYPEMEGFIPAYEAGLLELEATGAEIGIVVGNHDVGDKPDATMPTHPVEESMLEWYHQRVGPSWYVIERAGMAIFVLNSQILNTGMDAEAAQRRWLEASLEAAEGKRKLLFFHLPLYLDGPEEPGLGHYDVIGEPGRGWLVELIRKHGVEFAGGAHVHWAFFDRIGKCRYFQFASSSFTRPGFGQLFAAGPAPEQGRDDYPKLGFYRLRVLSERIDVHFIRTEGAPDRFRPPAPGFRPFLTRISAGLPGCRVGMSLVQPVSHRADVPIVFPSVIRHTVRNDYPLLLIQELGVRHLRVPDGDLDRPFQLERLSLLIGEGLSYDLNGFSLERLVDQAREGIGGKRPLNVEWQLEGVVLPDAERLRKARAELEGTGIGLSLCPVVPGPLIAGKQHPRTRFGYDEESLQNLVDFLKEEDLEVDRVLFRLESGNSNVERIRALRAGTGRGDSAPRLDFAFALGSLDDATNCRESLEALVASLLFEESRFFLEPLIDFDRTMDVANGLLDGRCNPRPAFNRFRLLNTLLFSKGEGLKVTRTEPGMAEFAFPCGESGLLAYGGEVPVIENWIQENSGGVRFGLTCLKSGFRLVGEGSALFGALASLGAEPELFINTEPEKTDEN